MMVRRWFWGLCLVTCCVLALLLPTALPSLALVLTDSVFYTVTYHAGGASRGVPPSAAQSEANSSVQVADNQGQPPLVREGYEFLGWSREPGGLDSWDVEYWPGDVIRNLRADYDLYPVWDSNNGRRYRHSITYYNSYAESGTAPAAQEYNRYAPATILGNDSTAPLVRAGYQFLGWHQQAGQEGQEQVQYAAGQRIESLEQDLILYPVWGPEGQGPPEPEPSSYTLTYTDEGANRGLPPAATTHAAGAAVTLPDNLGDAPLLRVGVEFQGWSSLPVGEPAQTLEFLPGGLIAAIDRNYLLHPYWDSNAGAHYWQTVTYHSTLAESGTAPAAQRVLRYDALEIAANQEQDALARPGYRFAGWSEQPMGAEAAAVSHQPGQRIESLDRDLELHPVWVADNTSADSYRITYHDSGASSGQAPAATLHENGSTAQIAGNTAAAPLIREGHEFLGWSEQPGGVVAADVAYWPGQVIAALTQDLDLYPVWDNNGGEGYRQTITYYNDGAVGGEAPVASSYPRYATAEIAANTATVPLYSAGCEFLGWSRSRGRLGAAQVEYWPGQTLPMLCEDLSLYPVWDDNDGAYYNHQLTYLAAGAEQGEPPEQQQSLRYGSVVIQGNDGTEEMIRRGNEFAGWAENPRATVQDVHYQPEDVLALIQEDLLLFPVWDDNGGALYWLTLTYEANLPEGLALLDGTQPPPAQQAPKYEVLEPVQPQLLVLGHRFAGWRLADAQELLTEPLTLTEDTTLEAVWQEQAPLTVTLEARGGSFAAGQTSLSYPLAYLAHLTLPEQQPSRAGHRFLGWSTSLTELQGWEEDRRLEEDLTLYAIWQAEDSGGGYEGDEDGDGNENGGEENNGNNNGGNPGGTGGGGGSSGGGSSGGGGSGGSPAVLSPVEDAPIPAGGFYGLALPRLSGERLRYLYGYTEDGTVRPDRTLTRAEAALLLYRLIEDEGKQQARTRGFTDVAAGAWYEQAVAYLAGLGILNGYPDGSFRPGQTVSRAEFVKMLTAFATASGGAEQSFRDLSAEHWAYSYLQAAVGQGWLQGYEDETLRPNQALTRAQAAALLNRLLGRAPSAAELAAWANPYADLSPEHWAYADILEASYAGNQTL